MTRATVAAKVAADKLKHPERYCPVKRCLWRVFDASNTQVPFMACPKHAAGVRT